MSEERDSSSAARPWLSAFVPPIVAAVAEWLLWPVVQPQVWFIFYPAVFLSSWLGGLRAAIASTVFSTVCVFWLFIAPTGAFPTEAVRVVPAALFLVTGTFFGVFHDRLRRANREVAAALAQSERDRESLRLAEAKAAGIVSIAADAIVSIDRNQRITLFNEGAEKTFGYARAEALGAPLERLLPERFRAHHRELVASFSAGQETSRRMRHGRSSQIFGRRKNGEEFPAEAAISRVEVAGEVILTVVLRDVTEQRRAEEEQTFLAELGARFASSLDAAETLQRVASGTVSFMADFVVLDLLDGGSPRRAAVASRDPASGALARALESTPPEAWPPLLESVARTGQPRLVFREANLGAVVDPPDPRGRALEEALRPRSVIVVPLTVRGATLGLMSFVSCTAGKDYDDSHLRLAEEVAHRGALALDNARLYQEAQRASVLRDEVLGIVAHDLRNPLSSIFIQAGLLRRRGDGEPSAARPVEVIERAATRIDRLIEDLLDVTRAEAGQLAVEPRRLSCAELVSEVLAAQRALAASASLELRSAVQAELPDVWADRHRLLQAFENLVGNALKFTQPGGAITIGAAPQPGEVEFWIQDTGLGIAAESLPHVFDRFWQARKAGRAGAGLGLAVARGIVEAHGGRIRVESGLGVGTTFFFTIPQAGGASVGQRHRG